jgi:hypothetical protein
MITLNYQGLDGTQLHLFCREESVAVLAAIIQQGRYMHKDPLIYALYAPNMTIKSPKGSIEVPFFPEIKAINLLPETCKTARSHVPLTSLFQEYLLYVNLQDAVNVIPISVDSNGAYKIEVIDQETHILPYVLCRSTFDVC